MKCAMGNAGIVLKVTFFKTLVHLAEKLDTFVGSLAKA